MAAQNLVIQKGVGSFIVGNSEITPDSALGVPYPSSAGSVDFVPRSTADRDMLFGTNHPTTPQHTGSTTVAFLYSTWTEDV